MTAFPFRNVLITGGAGFIGSHFVNYVVSKYPESNFYTIDALNYCSNLDNIHVSNSPNHHFIHSKLQNQALVSKLLHEHQIDCIVHFAAQSHVDSSWHDPMLFIDDNIVATQVLLECSKSYMQSGGLLKRFLYISTDEVYGDSTMSSSTESKTEDCKLQPTNPYAATKAAAEMLCSSYLHSYKLPIIISRSNNVYGSAQYREKLIPKFIELILNDKPCTIHGDGNYLRSFLYAFDVCTGLETMLLKGSVGHVYNIGSEDEFTVNDIADILIKHLKPNDNPSDWKVFVEDRAFNDTRYLISSDKLKLLGWKQSVSFDKGLQSTIDWYVKKQRLDSVHART